MENNVIASLSQRAGPQVLSAIKDASARTGVNFAYLLEQAAAESSFNAKAKARTSSATGLYQFIESTWMNMVRDHGHKHGLGEYADKIDRRGRVADPGLRREILDLRNDPRKAAAMAAEFASDNERHLRRTVGGDIGPTDLYMAHFLGAGGASSFLNAMKDNPLQPAADLFPSAARANRNVFYDSRTGQPRTLAGVYDIFNRKFQGSESGAASQPVQMAESAPVPPQKPRQGTELIYHAVRPSNAVASKAAELFNGRGSAWPSQQAMQHNNPFPAFNSRSALSVNAVELLLMAQLDTSFRR